MKELRKGKAERVGKEMETHLQDSPAQKKNNPNKLACVACRRRRRKCDRQVPCSTCSKAGTMCMYDNRDLRRNRHSTAYVKALEDRISSLESALRDIREAKVAELCHTGGGGGDVANNNNNNNNNKNNVREEPHGRNLLSPGLQCNLTSSSPHITEVSLLKHETEDRLRDLHRGRSTISDCSNSTDRDRDECRASSNIPITSVIDATTNSIYPSNSLCIAKKKKTTREKEMQQQHQLQTQLKNLPRNPLVLRAFSLFFKYLYPGHYMFIHRETFLSAFFGDKSTKAYYCSEELVFAIAALGSKMSDKGSELYSKSEIYYHRAKSIVLKKIFHLEGQEGQALAESTSSTKLAIVQTLLCLAFYDIGCGENPMAWYLSGLAFRIAHEIGLHLNPKAWTNVYEDELSKIDFEVRSRIYWGCYIADHLISILFGRSTSLKVSNSTVPETDELPDIVTGIEEYIFEPGVSLSMATPLKKLIVLSRITEIFAGKIFIQAESLAQRIRYLSKFNAEMYTWRQDLSPDLKWDINTLKNLKKFNPTISYVWFHYYIVLISYNKPFILDSIESRQLVLEYVEELHYLLQLWRAQYGTFELCNLYMVYAAILVIQCLNILSLKGNHYTEFETFLKSDTLNYEVAKKFIENCENPNNNSELNTEFTDLLGSLSHGTGFALEYNFDFTLLNEIDNLVSTSSTHRPW